jgi:tripartite-type tricarboxylate transporter receptor subunit TctC
MTPGEAMQLPRRQFLLLTSGAAALSAASRIATAQTYPSRPVRWIVGFAAGGGNDIVARLIGQWLSERTGQQFFIENRPGAGTNIATEVVVNAPPDGYTLLLVGLPNASNASLFNKLSFNFIRDITPIAGIMRVPNVLVVNPSVPAKTVPEFIAYAKSNPGKVNMASAGTGSGSHLAGELFKMMAGINLVHVPYRGNGPAITALLGGQVEVLFPPPTGSIAFIKTGKLHALAVTSAIRSEALPDLPTIGEFIPGYEMSAWYGVGAPKRTPAEVIDKINKEINAGLADSEMKARLAEQGGVAIAGSPVDFGKLIAEETEKWGKVVRAANIKAD